MREINNLVGQKVRAKSEEIRRETIRKATGREMYSEIYKPITEGIESQKEELSQLKTLPGIKEQLALLSKGISEDLTQGITELTKKQQDLKPAPYIPIHMGDEPVQRVPQDEFKKLEAYGREKMGITEKPLPPEKIMTKEEISKLSKEEINELVENYMPIETEDRFIKLLSKEHKDWDTDNDVYEEAEEFPEELGAKPKQVENDLNKDIDLELLDTKKYWTPQEVFDFFHTESENPDEKK